ncbi:MAG TPA: hypothetical protein VGK47_14815 [Nitrososphaeraceae archaeon]
MGTKILNAYGVGQPTIPVMPPPILANRAPASSDTDYPIGQVWVDQSVSPSVLYSHVGGGDWDTGGNAEATTSSFGIVRLATFSELENGDAPPGAIVPTSNDVATVIQGIVVGAVPPAQEGQAGIAEIATQVETDAGLDDSRIVTPLKLATYIAGGGAGAGVFTDLTATGTVSFTGATGGITMTSATASSFGTTGAGIDLTLDSAAGRVIINGEEAAANAITLLSAAGGIDVDAALQINIASSQNAVDAIRIVSSAGGIDIDAVGAATEDINITNTGGSIVLQATESAVDSIDIISTAGGIRLRATGAAATEDISLTATGSSIVLSATEAVSDAINIDATAGGIDVDAVGQINIATSQSAADSIVIESTAGGIDILASGAAAGEDIDIIATGSSVNISSTENAALAITLNTNGGTSETIRVRNQQGTNAASIELVSTAGGLTLTGGLSTADAVNIVASAAGGGIDIDAGTAGVIVDTTGGISLDAAAASNFTATGAFDITIQSTAGSINLNAGEAAADAINIDSTGGVDVDAALQINLDSSQAAATAVRIVASNAGGGIDIDAGTGGIAVDTTGAFSIDGAAASNVTVTGAGIDLTLSSSGGSVLVSSTEDAALAIRLHANGGTSETIQVHSDQGTGVSSVGLLSDVGGITLRATGLASADAINLEAPAGGIDADAALQINIASSQAAATAIQLTASDAAGGITATTGTGNFNVSGGHLSIASVARTLLVNGGAATDFIGTGVLVAGASAPIANTNIAAGDVILLARTAVNASTTLGELTYTINAGVSFTVRSAIIGTPGSDQTGDVSSFAYFIVRPT